MDWIDLTKTEQLVEIEQEKEPIVIFKHSTRCVISAMAYQRMNAKISTFEGYKLFYLDLLNFRNISNEIANKYRIEHQSPQVLVIKNNSVIYHTSHNGINPQELLSILKS